MFPCFLLLLFRSYCEKDRKKNILLYCMANICSLCGHEKHGKLFFSQISKFGSSKLLSFCPSGFVDGQGTPQPFHMEERKEEVKGTKGKLDTPTPTPLTHTNKQTPDQY